MVNKSIKKAFELPKGKSEWMITVCGIIYAMTAIYLNEFFNIDLLTASKKSLLYFWLLGLICDLSLAIVISYIIIFGIRSIRRGGLTIKSFIFPALAVLFCFLITGIAIYAQISIPRIHHAIFDTPESYKVNLKVAFNNKDLTLLQRSKASILYARQVWKETGVTIEYITSEGKEMIYEPSIEEIEGKKMMAKTIVLMEWKLKGMKRASILWPIIAFTSVAIGFFTPIKRNNELVN